MDAFFREVFCESYFPVKKYKVFMNLRQKETLWKMILNVLENILETKIKDIWSSFLNSLFNMIKLGQDNDKC